MKILSKATALIFLALFAANAQEQAPEKDNMKTTIYLHPVTLLFGVAAKAPLIYLTVEQPFSPYNALIVRPNAWIADGSIYRIGSDLGFRHYLAGGGEGMHLQLQGGVFYLAEDEYKIEFNWGDDDEKKDKGSSLWWDIMGYFGYSHKFAYASLYSDTGVGFGCMANICSLLFDLNFGVGFSF
ncbi:MAG: hypothetical protein FWC26_03100 [Fibromonadales bacterium]|nr:hypothetical protein [Fibromonadales bacterium]